MMEKIDKIKFLKYLNQKTSKYGVNAAHTKAIFVILIEEMIKDLFVDKKRIKIRNFVRIHVNTAKKFMAYYKKLGKAFEKKGGVRRVKMVLWKNVTILFRKYADVDKCIARD